MSNYTRTTNFTAKDGLSPGNPGKKILGSEFQTEFDNIATMSATKVDSASPTFTGTATIPTAAVTTLTLGGVTVTSTAAELNILDGVTATASELNILDGCTATVTEVNYLSGATSNIQAQIDAISGVSGTVTSVGATVPTGFTVSGTPITSAGTLAIAFDTGYSLPSDATQANWTTAYGWGNHASAGYLTDVAFGDIQAGSVLTSLEAFVDTDTQLMTAAAIDDRIDTKVAASGGGTVTSVAMTTPTGLTVTGSPITTTGTLAVGLQSGYAIPTTAKQTQWDTAYGWGDHGTQGYVTGLTDMSVTATFAELNAADGASAGTVVNSKNVIYSAGGAVAATSISIGNWSINLQTNELVFTYNGTDVAKIKTTGEIVSANDVTAFGTV